MNSTIKSRLFGGLSAILLLLVVISSLMLYQFSQTRERFTHMAESSLRKVDLSHEVMEGVLHVARLEKDLLMENDMAQQELLKKTISLAISNTERKLKELDGLADEKGRIFLTEYRDAWETYRRNLGEVIALSGTERQADALSLSKRGDIVMDRAMSQLEQLIIKNRLDIESESIRNDENYSTGLVTILAFIAFSILLAVILFWWIVSRVNNRISAIARKAEKIASREFYDETLEQTIDDEMNPIVRSLISINDSFREVTENANLVASGEYSVKMEPRSERDVLGNALKKMAFSLQRTTAENQKNSWLTTGLNRFNDVMMGNQDIEELCDNIISFLANYLNGSIGAIYLLNERENLMELKGRYAFSTRKNPKQKFPFGEGLIGQAAQEKKSIVLNNVQGHLLITSSIVEAPPTHLIVIPFVFEEKVLGVIELGKLSGFEQKEQEFMETSVENIALAVHSAVARKKIQELLNETQVQSEELQSQQEELRQMNEELEEQTQNLRQQQEELQMTNEELEEQTQSLEIKNKELEAAKYDVEQKTKQLEVSSKYKSEFLANMSHELRTPLNSLLILSKDLAENKESNLDDDQIESAEIIYKSGHDLLLLINEVLDLSRVEAGKMSIHVEKIDLRAFINGLLKFFKGQAKEKNLELTAHLDGDLPEFIQTDPQRLNQIMKNLLSNALKFTEVGQVGIHVSRKGNSSLKISVSDTGIGIRKEKQLAVFEAFQQADGGTARRYGGTGLGLSISREIAKLLEAELSLKSEVNKGSVFSLVLPIRMTESDLPKGNEEVMVKTVVPDRNYLNYPSIDDDRGNIDKNDKVVLIIEDDLQFAKILKRQANQKAFKAITAASGEDGLQLALQYKPHAIILDIELPGMNGRQVLSQIKANPEIRHIPVHVVSVDERTLDPIKEGAVEYLMKPIAKNDLEKAFGRIENFVERKMKNLLIIEDDANSRTAIKKLIGNGDVNCLEAGSGKEALETYAKNAIDCIVLDIGLPDMSGFDLIYKLEKDTENVPPIIIYTGKELSREENEELEKYTDSIIIKGVKSEERLLDETALFLHRTISNLPEPKQRMISQLYDRNTFFKDKKILVVDDDMRNVFALSKVLKEKGMEVVKADNGISALKALEKESGVDLVLMDIMMPEMDGYEAMQKIRAQQRFLDLPVIALTAKAMKDDKQKCIDAGANDYIAKPIDISRLLSLMQVWLSR